MLAAKGYTVENGMTADGNADMAWNYNVASLDKDTYSVSAVTGEAITNQFDNADPSYYGMDGINYHLAPGRYPGSQRGSDCRLEHDRQLYR